MIKRALIALAMAGIYVWIRRQQHTLGAPMKTPLDEEANWANEGGAHPAEGV